ncbi:unnamed protein product [Ceutorhynchus assimilis]|uniref:RRM domain-containing protein n=1 Tax=Ceutorhynchus assimilis TaxID=467358 RepID=A0A9N9MY07_9CUCU|nr:unnamed protein product [Ceutorhynchus assimilis]
MIGDRTEEDEKVLSVKSDICGAFHAHIHALLSSRRRHTGSREDPQPSRCLGVFGLSVYTTEDELYHIFNKYGPVERVQVVIDAKTARSRGFAFVYFKSSDDAKVAKEKCTGMKINQKSIRVDFSITERAHTPTPGIYMGKPTHKYDRYESRGRRGDRDREIGEKETIINYIFLIIAGVLDTGALHLLIIVAGAAGDIQDLAVIHPGSEQELLDEIEVY